MMRPEIEQLLRDLDDQAAAGLDLSPGDDCARRAAGLIRECIADHDNAQLVTRGLISECDRLLSGKFTKDEIHNICHNLHGTVSAEEFAKGCSDEQRKLYGCAPDADRIRDIIKIYDMRFQRIAAEAQALYESIMDAANEDTNL